MNQSKNSTKPDPRCVFVVHGRNLEIRNSIFRFLRSIGLKPLEWSHAIELTGKPSPYIGEILDSAFSEAQAVVVLMTPDDEARLQELYRSTDDPAYESELMGQARPNVLFEAGMAFGRDPKRTVIVELGKVRPFSDIGGRHIVKLNDTPAARQQLAQRLEKAGCAVDLKGIDWHSEGDFDNQSRPGTETSRNEEKIATKSHESLTNARIDLDDIVASLHRLAVYEDFYLAHEIPQRNIKNAMARFVPKTEQMLAFLDNTDGNSGCDGLAFTPHGIYWRNNHYESPHDLTWNQLAEMPIRGSDANDEVRLGASLTIDLSGSNVIAGDLAKVLRSIIEAIRASIKSSTATPAVGRSMPAASTDKLITFNLPIVKAKNVSANYQKMINMIYLFTRFDQIEKTGAWGKSLVGLYYPLLIKNHKRPDRPSKETKEEGGITTTSLTLLALKDFWRHDEKYFSMPFVQKGKNYFQMRNVKGFGILSETRRDGTRLPSLSSRHTAMAVLAMMGLKGSPIKIIEGLTYIIENLDNEISSPKRESCPSVALAAAIAAFECFNGSAVSHPVIKTIGNAKLVKFLENWNRNRTKWENQLHDIKSDIDILWPPYAGLQEFRFYSSFMVYGLIPGLLQGIHKTRFFDFFDLIFSSEHGGGVPFSYGMNLPDFGTTAKTLSILKSPIVTELFDKNGKKSIYNEKIRQYENFLLSNYADVESEIFDMIYTETISSLLPSGVLLDHRHQMERLERLETVISQVGYQLEAGIEKLKIDNKLNSEYPYLRSLIMDRIDRPYVNC